MELITILSKKYVFVEANIQDRYIQITWLEQPKSDDFRETKTSALNFVLKHDITRWLCDMRGMVYLEIADQNWLVREIFSSFNPQHSHVLAYLISTAGLESMTSFRIHELVTNDPELNKQLSVEIFFQKQIALQWLFETQKIF